MHLNVVNRSECLKLAHKTSFPGVIIHAWPNLMFVWFIALAAYIYTYQVTDAMQEDPKQGNPSRELGLSDIGLSKIWII